MAGMKWKMGKVDKTDMGRSIREKFQKAFSSIGVHRDIDRLSKINNEKKLEEEINKMAAAKYPAGSKQYFAYAQSIYDEIKKIRFERENRRMLKSLYETVKKFRGKKLDAKMLSPEGTNFYDTVSSAKNYYEFVSVLYENFGEELNIDKINSELREPMGKSFILTYANKNPITLPKNVADIYAKLMIIRQEFNQVEKKVEADYKKLTSEVERFNSNELIPQSKKDEVTVAFNNKHPDNVVAFRFRQVDDALGKIKKFKRLLSKKIMLADRLDANIRDGDVGETLVQLHMLLSPRSEASPENVLKNARDEYSKIRMMMNKATSGHVSVPRAADPRKNLEERLTGTQKNNTSSRTGNGTSVSELRKKFEGKPIMGGRKNR